MDFLRKKLRILRDLSQKAASYRESAREYRRARNFPSYIKAKKKYSTTLYHISQVERDIENARRDIRIADIQDSEP